MDVLFSTLSSIFVECFRPLCGSFYCNSKNFFKFGSNMDKLDSAMRNLLDKKNKIEEEVELAGVEGKISTPQVSTWLRKVEEIELSMNSIQGEVAANKHYLHGCCLSCSLRYRLSKKLVQKLKEVKLIESCPNPLVMVDSRVIAVEHLPGPSIMDQNTASRNVAKILDLLNDDRYGTIGVLGMGGVGKTTLIRNLNNQLRCMSSAQPFSLVIWVTVSKDCELGRIQVQIAERLNLALGRESIEGKAIQLFNRLEKEKKFIVILDDVWEWIDLDKIGIPQPKHRLGCKIIVTTRSLDVCREMATDVEFSVVPLCDEEAWELFSETAGDVVNSEPVKLLAKHLSNECAGLPLALLTVGRAMRGKTKVELWKAALRALQRSNPVPYIKGIEKEVFLPLKWSYDSMEGKNIKQCFLYCCLYPEDFSIEVKELVQCWLAEGLLDESEDHEESYNIGIALVENLKDGCLLECGDREGTVRMHDVVRDVAIWIASCLEEGHKSLVRSGFCSNQITGPQKWGSFKRVSLMYSSIEVIPECVAECSQVSALLLQGNAQLVKIPFRFLQGFNSLRVLNLSNSQIETLPLLENLAHLRALFLRQCNCLKAFPPLRVLPRLQVLDLSGTIIKMSPHEEEMMLDELRFQEHLLEFYFDVEDVPSITVADSVWLTRLRGLTICIGFARPLYRPTHNERIICITRAKYSTEAIMLLWSNASNLVLFECEFITEMWTSVSVGGLDCLKSLVIHYSSWTGSMGIHDGRYELVLLPSLEILHCRSIKYLWRMSSLLINSGSNIRIIKVEYCHELKKLSHFDLLHKLENLEEFYVESCNNLREIMTGYALPSNALPKLQIMKLGRLPKLHSICQETLSWSPLKRIEVTGCPVLKLLPLSSEHASTIEAIHGEPDWWEQLCWENEDFKHHFHPIVYQ